MKKLLQNVIVFFSLTLYTVSSAQPPPISASFSPSVVHDPTYFGLNGANVWENSAGYIAVDNLLLPIKVKHVRHIGGG